MFYYGCVGKETAMKKEELWKGYLEEGNRDEGCQAWAFCGGGKEADELLALVKEGKKRGTASSLISYEMEKEPIPKEGRQVHCIG